MQPLNSSSVWNKVLYLLQLSSDWQTFKNKVWDSCIKDNAFVSHYKEPEENNSTNNKLNLLFIGCTVFYFVFTWGWGGFHWLGRKWPQCSKATCPDDDTGSTFPAPVRSHPGNRKPFPCWHKPRDWKCYSFLFFLFFVPYSYPPTLFLFCSLN